MGLCVGMCMWVWFPGPEEGFSCELPPVDAENQTQVLCKEQYRPVTAEPAPAMETVILGISSSKTQLCNVWRSPLKTFPPSTWPFRVFLSCQVLLLFLLSLFPDLGSPLSVWILWLSPLGDDACIFAFHCAKPAICFAKQTTLSFQSTIRWEWYLKNKQHYDSIKHTVQQQQKSFKYVIQFPWWEKKKIRL